MNENPKIFLSVAIPTYNRAGSLEKVLNNFLPQAIESKELVEICISNNGSKDNTREVVIKLQKEYPDLIKYGENKENLGVDANILKVVQMCQGEFIWTFSDDDYIVENGLAEVVNFLKKNDTKNMGLAVLRVKSFLVNQQTSEKKFFSTNFEEEKPEVFLIDRKEIIGLSFKCIAFLSILVYNNKFLKKLLQEDLAQVEQAIGTSHLHMVLFSLMFLKYPQLCGFVFNKIIVCQDISQYKYFIEDKFMLHYFMQKKLDNLLLHNKYMTDEYAPLIVKREKPLMMDFVVDMAAMRAFEYFNYFSYFGCLKLFFKNSSFTDALIFSLVFSLLFLVPPVVLTSLYKGLLMLKLGKKWKEKWEVTSAAARWVSQGTRRRNEQPH